MLESLGISWLQVRQTSGLYVHQARGVGMGMIDRLCGCLSVGGRESLCGGHCVLDESELIVYIVCGGVDGYRDRGRRVVVRRKSDLIATTDRNVVGINKVAGNRSECRLQRCRLMNVCLRKGWRMERNGIRCGTRGGGVVK